MSHRAAVASLLCAAAGLLAGCGVGAGGDGGSADVLVTRDFGATEVGKASATGIPAGETVMRLLQRRFDVETRYGGGFVQSINGLAGGARAGREVDWFYYVNGVEADVGANERKIADGDRVWWDHRDWSTAMSVPAIVGSFPEPFRSGIEGKLRPVRIDCARDAGDVCDEVQRRLEAGDVRSASKALAGTDVGPETLRVIVGTWASVRADRAALLLEQGPGASGIFARMNAEGTEIALLDERGRVERTLTDGAGLVAATRFEDQQPTWFVTGTDAAGVASAAAALEEEVLAGRFAIALEDGRSVPLPVRPERP